MTLQLAGSRNPICWITQSGGPFIDVRAGGVIACAGSHPWIALPTSDTLLELCLPKITLTGRERELIALLAEGHTDVSAAEQMQISPRSVTNILRNLMDRLGVENRFQLGLSLGFQRKAHVPPPDPTATKDL